MVTWGPTKLMTRITHFMAYSFSPESTMANTPKRFSSSDCRWGVNSPDENLSCPPSCRQDDVTVETHRVCLQQGNLTENQRPSSGLCRFCHPGNTVSMTVHFQKHQIMLEVSTFSWIKARPQRSGSGLGWLTLEARSRSMCMAAYECTTLLSDLSRATRCGKISSRAGLGS